MEDRSDTGVMPNREQFSVTLQKQNAQSSPMQNMRLTFTPEGTAVYIPVATTTASAATQPKTPGGDPTEGEDGAKGPTPAIFAPHHGFDINNSDQLMKKSGRPRKYGPDGAMTSPLPSILSSSDSHGSGLGPPFLGPRPVMSTIAAEALKMRGRPAGPSRKKLQMAALGLAGTGFTTHVVTVKAGEDVSAKIMSFPQNGPHAICILSANGAISNVTLSQAAMYGGTVTYEDRFEILSLSGSFLPSESWGQCSRTGGLSVTLSGPDGRVLGGRVAGLLIAASPVQVVLGRFILHTKEEHNQNIYTSVNRTSAPVKFGTSGPVPMAGDKSPSSQYTSSESSGGSGSPMNHSMGNPCNNSDSHVMPNMPWK